MSAKLNVTKVAARRKINVFVLNEIGTGLGSDNSPSAPSIVVRRAVLALPQTNNVLITTRAEVEALAAAGILADDEHTRLRKAHTFLRWLIDGLRMVRGNARDLTVPPAGSEPFAFLARRLHYGSEVERLSGDLARHMGAVRELVGKLL